MICPWKVSAWRDRDTHEHGFPPRQVYVDTRQFGTESLVHPLLHETQGPALVMYLPDLTMHPDDIVRLQSPMKGEDPSAPLIYVVDGPGPLIRSVALRVYTDIAVRRLSGARGHGADDGDKHATWPPQGNGLLSLYHFSDLITVRRGSAGLLSVSCESLTLTSSALLVICLARSCRRTTSTSSTPVGSTCCLTPTPRKPMQRRARGRRSAASKQGPGVRPAGIRLVESRHHHPRPGRPA